MGVVSVDVVSEEKVLEVSPPLSILFKLLYTEYAANAASKAVINNKV